MSPRRPLGPRHCANSIDPPTRDKHSGRNTSSATIAHTPHPYYTPVHRARRPGAYLTLPLPLSTYNFLHTVTAVHWSLFCINLEFRQSHFLRILVTDVDNVSIYCYHVFVYLLFSKIFFSSHIHILYFCFLNHMLATKIGLHPLTWVAPIYGGSKISMIKCMLLLWICVFGNTPLSTHAGYKCLKTISYHHYEQKFYIAYLTVFNTNFIIMLHFS